MELLTRTARVWLDDEGIIENIDFPGLTHSLADAEENTNAYRLLANGVRRPVLVRIGRVKAISREARACYAEADAANAVALVVSSPVSRAIGNFFLGLNRPSVPTRLFSNDDDARVWLRGFLGAQG